MLTCCYIPTVYVSFLTKFTSQKSKGPKVVADEFKRTKDSQDAGKEPDKHIDLTFFDLSWTFPCGPVGIKLGKS